jgi:hypothetical protein
MMQEIASKDGNFCGVCPVIGRLNCFCFAQAYIAAAEKGSALRRPFFMAQNDTHGGADKQFDRTQTLRKLSTLHSRRKTNHGKPGNDPHPAEGL